MVKFAEHHLPLITKASFCALKTGFGVNEDLYKTHIARVELEDVPASSEAKPPRLCIKSVLPVKIVDLPKILQNQCQEGGKRFSKMIDMTPVVGGVYVVMVLVMYRPPNHGEAPTRIFNFATDKYGLHNEYKKLGSNLSKQLQQRSLISEVIKYKKTINDMATGKAEKIKKNFMK